MNGFRFDTSGEVALERYIRPTRGPREVIRWSDLSHFEQGYIEAMLIGVDLVGTWLDTVDPFRAPGFSDLAPETLARIMEDCERLVAWLEASTNIADQKAGGECWSQRGNGTFAAYGFPPFAVSLNADGKVVFS